MNRLTGLTGIIAALMVVMTASRLSTVAQNVPNKGSSDTLPDGPGKEIVIKKCIRCHDVRQTTMRPGSGSEDEWGAVVDKMMSRGADLTDDEADLVVQYLATNYGPNSKTPHSASPATAAGNPSPDKAAPTGGVADAGSSETSSPVNVNKTTAEELEAALGLSKAEAEAIVQYREQHGSLKDWQEVSSIPGVPPEKIKDNQKRLIF
jgi:competence ComEA-like helix-hairpin-helix protein